jgi:uncharacterized protein (DUF58 family)
MREIKVTHHVSRITYQAMKDLPIFIIFLLLLAFLTRVDFIFYIIYVCVGVYLLSQWYTPRALGNLGIRRRFSDHAFLGEQVAVTLELENRGRLPLPWVQFSESVPLMLRTERPVNQVITLPGRQQRDVTYSVQAMRRGYYRLGPLRLAAGDQFGFNERQFRLRADYLTVYPRITPLTRLGLPSRLPFGTIASRQRLFEDPARPVGVRGYRSGDSLRQINWKVSAHTENLVVKTFQPAISLETAVLLNLDGRDYSDRYGGPEWAIELAASLAAHLVEQRQPVGLITNGADPLRQEQSPAFDEESGRLLFAPPNSQIPNPNLRSPNPLVLDPASSSIQNPKSKIQNPHRPPAILPRPGRAHLMKVLEVLARVEAAETVSFTRWLPSACLHLSWGVTILVITPLGDEATCQALHRLVRAGYNPVLLVAQATATFGRVQERARRLGFSAYYVPERRDLSKWRHGRRTG